MSDPRLHLKHVFSLGYCERGARLMARRYGVDFNQLAREGVPLSALREISNPLVRKAVEVAEKEADRGKR